MIVWGTRLGIQGLYHIKIYFIIVTLCKFYFLKVELIKCQLRYTCKHFKTMTKQSERLEKILLSQEKGNIKTNLSESGIMMIPVRLMEILKSFFIYKRNIIKN